MLDIGPTLQTARLSLRPPIEADLDPWAAMMADEGVAHFIGGVQSRPLVWRAMATVAGSWVLRGFGMFSVIERESGRWLGRVGPLHPEGWPGDEVGWGLVREAWGRGFAREAAIACIDFVFDRLGWTKVIHSIDPQNAPSIALATRLGSTNWGPGCLPDPVASARIDLWGQTRDEWRTRRATL